MALRLGKINEIPSGAVRLTKDEAINYQYKRARNWDPQSEMWPLLYGSPALGIVNSFSGVFINELFRRKCFLPKSALFVVGFPIIVVSTMSFTLLHNQYVTSDLLIVDTKCMPCMQGRTALLLGFFGTAYPLIACSIGSMMTAQKINSIYVPSLAKEPKQFFKACLQMIQKKSNLFSGLFVLNVVVAVICTHLQQKASFKLNEAQ